MGSQHFDELGQALAWLDSHIDYERVAPTRRSVPTLDAMYEMARLLGNPERSFPSIHLTGTNGKGSTSALVTALLSAMGLSTGTYTSPNLVTVNERISFSGVPIADRELTEVLEILAQVVPLLAERPTRFELLTMAAFRSFSDAAVDAGVIEVGLGGSWDSTNIIDAEVSVLTNVDLDHVEILGPTKAHIARDKCGIFRASKVAVTGEQDPDVLAVIEGEARAREVERLVVVGSDVVLERNDVAVGGRLVTLSTPYGRYDDVFLGLHGAHQGLNAAVAIAAVEAFFDRSLPPAVVEEALGGATMAARCEVLGHRPLVIVDGAHNPAGARALAATIAEAFEVEGRRTVVTGMLRGRDPKELLQPLAEVGFSRAIVCQPDTPRAMDLDEVVAAAQSVGMTVEVHREVAIAVRRALTEAGVDDLVLVAGSLYVAGTARSAAVGYLTDGGTRR